MGFLLDCYGCCVQPEPVEERTASKLVSSTASCQACSCSCIIVFRAVVSTLNCSCWTSNELLTYRGWQPKCMVLLLRGDVSIWGELACCLVGCFWATCTLQKSVLQELCMPKQWSGPSLRSCCSNRTAHLLSGSLLLILIAHLAALVRRFCVDSVSLPFPL